MKITAMYTSVIARKEIKVVMGGPVTLGSGGKEIGHIVSGEVLADGSQEVGIVITDKSAFKDIQNAIIGEVSIGSTYKKNKNKVLKQNPSATDRIRIIDASKK